MHQQPMLSTQFSKYEKKKNRKKLNKFVNEFNAHRCTKSTSSYQLGLLMETIVPTNRGKTKYDIYLLNNTKVHSPDVAASVSLDALNKLRAVKSSNCIFFCSSDFIFVS